MFLTFVAPMTAPITLKWSPKVDDKLAYKVTIHLETEGNKLDLGGKRIRSFTKVDGDTVLVSDESSITLPDSTTTVTIVQSSFKSDGTLVDAVTDLHQEDSFRFERLRELVFPDKQISIGDSWTASSLPDKNASLTGVKINYTFVGEEKVGGVETYRIEAKGGETGDSATKTESTFWLDEKTGNPIHIHVKITKAVFPGDGGRSLDVDEDDLLQSS